MSNLLNKIRGTDESEAHNTFGGRNNHQGDSATGRSSANTYDNNTTGSSGMNYSDGNSSIRSDYASETTGTGYSGNTGRSGAAAGMSSGDYTTTGTGTTTATTTTQGTGHGLAHVTGEAAYAHTEFPHSADVKFTGQSTEANVTVENQATQVQVPGQTINAKLPAKQVVVEVPERQVEVSLPPRAIQLENNPEIEVTTHPNIRSVGVNASTTGVSGNTNTTDRTDPRTSSNY